MNHQIVNLKSHVFYLFLAIAFICPIKQLCAETKKFYIDAAKGNDQNDGVHRRWLLSRFPA